MIFAEVRKVLETRVHHHRPVVTLSWAQSLNGSITLKQGEKTILSDPLTMEMLHTLRSMHKGLMVGIGTILADDPQLNVRLVQGPSPTPIILDTNLRIPLGAKILQREDSKPWIFYSDAKEEKKKQLQELGAWLFPVSWGPAGIHLKAVLEILKAEGISNLMVEGGAGVLSSFLREKVMDQGVVTICPFLMSGLSFPNYDHLPPGKIAFSETKVVPQGSDLVYWGQWK